MAGLAVTVLIAGCAPAQPLSVSERLEAVTSLSEGLVDSLTPTLTWPAVATVPPGTTRVTYDLRVWQAEAGYPAVLVYARDRLPEPQHALAEPLRPDTAYMWTTRARLEVDGQVRLTDWRARYGPRFGILPHPLYARFRTPGP